MRAFFPSRLSSRIRDLLVQDNGPLRTEELNVSVSRLDYKGRHILRADYRGCKTEEAMVSVLDDLIREVETAPRAVLILSDFTDSAVGSSFMSKGKTFGKQYDAKIAKSAMLGVAGMKEILLRAFLAFTGSRTTRTFPTEAEALDWLAE